MRAAAATRIPKGLSRSALVGYVALIAISLVVLAPLAWAVSTSLKSVPELYAYPPVAWPRDPQWQNYPNAWNTLPFNRFLANSLFLAAANILGRLISVTLIAYGFARFSFPGRNIMFYSVLAVLMLPGHVTLIPTYIIFLNLDLVGTFVPLFIRSFFGDAFLVFLVRQYIMSIPRELDEAARVDGASHLQVLWHVLLPLLRPPLTIVVVFTFLAVWNDYLGPLVYLRDRDTYTMALGLTFFQQQYGGMQHFLLATSVLMMLPPMVIYFFAQRHLIGGIASVGLKG